MVRLIYEYCHQTLFSLFFFGPFQPNFFTFLIVTHFFSYVILCLCFITLMTRQQGHNSIGNGTQDHLLLTLAVGPPHDLLGYGIPKTVHP